MIADVDNERVGNGLDGDPLAAKLNLEPLDIVLQQESEEAVVGMGRHSECQIGFRAGWIVVYDHEVRSIIEFLEVATVHYQDLKDRCHDITEQGFDLLSI